MNEEDEKSAKLSLQEEVRRLAPADDPNGQRMLAELFGELPATHPDSPYADQARAMRRNNPKPRL